MSVTIVSNQGATGTAVNTSRLNPNMRCPSVRNCVFGAHNPKEVQMSSSECIDDVDIDVKSAVSRKVFDQLSK